MGCDPGPGTQPRGDAHLTGSFDASAVSLNDIVWKFRAEREIGGSPAFRADTLYVASADGTLRAHRSQDGQPLWEVDLGAPSYGGANATAKRLLVGTDDGVVAVGYDGRTQWTYRTSAPVDAGVVVADSIAYFGSRDGTIWAVDAVGGSLIWKATTAGPIDSACALISGGVVCGGQDGYVWLLDRQTGETKWSWSPRAAIRGLTVDGDSIFVAAGSRIVALAHAEPKVRWQFDAGAPIGTPPSVIAGTVLVGAGDGEVVAVSASDGANRWRFTAGSPAKGAITGSGGVIYVPTMTAGVVALTSDGKKAWTFRTDGPVAAGPIAVGSRLYVADLAGSIYAIE